MAHRLIEARANRVSAYVRTTTTARMGGLVSKAKLILYATIKAGETYDLVKTRLNTPPGLPVSNPTLPLWTVPAAEIPTEPTDEIPEAADIVVIGSGITGTSFIYNLLSHETRLNIVMLEARQACSGATGRHATSLIPSVLLTCYLDTQKWRSYQSPVIP